MKKSYHIKNDSHPILAELGRDQFLIRINDKGNEIIVKSLNSFLFKSVTPLQTKFETLVEKNIKSLHQQPLLLNDTDITSDDEEHINTRTSKQVSYSTTDKT